MALLKNKVNITLNKGVNQKIDEKVGIVGELTELENAVFVKAGELKKRNGYEVLSKETSDGNLINKASALGTYRNELNLYTGDKLFTYSESTSRWIEKGSIINIVADSSPIQINTQQQFSLGVEHLLGYSLYCWQEVGGGVYYSVIDEQTGTKIVHNALISNALERPKVAKLGSSYFCIFAYNSSTTALEYYIISASDFNTPLTSGSFAANINTTSKNYDVVSNNNKIGVAFHTSTGTTQFRSIDINFVLSGFVTVSTLPAERAISITSDDFGRYWIVTATFGASTSFRLIGLSFLENITFADKLVCTFVPNTVVNVTSIITGNFINVFFETSETSPSNHVLRSFTFDYVTNPLASTSFIITRAAGLAGKVFLQQSQILIPIVHSSTLQSTYYLIATNGSTLARLSIGTGGNVISDRNLSNLPRLDNNRVVFVSQVKSRLESNAGNLFSRLGVNSTVLDFSNESRFQNTELGVLYIAGACPQIYDGVTVVEQGFNMFPEGITAAPNTLSGGAVANGTYSITACYEWTDNQGFVHRSAPAVPVRVTTTGSTNSITVTVPNLRLTNKFDVRIVIYSTENNGTIFYRVSSLSSPIINNKLTDFSTFNRLEADSAIIGNDFLYTTGGVLENIAAPSSSIIVNYKNRLFLAGLENKLSLAYSKVNFGNDPVEFTDFFNLPIDARGGDITALGVLDDYLVIFKQNSIFVLNGIGPNNKGEQDDFNNPQLITTDVGCSNQNSIVITPVGLMFKSNKGIYLLSRSLSVEYIGAQVENFNDKLITSSELLNTVNQVRFVTNDNVCLVYDYFFKQWSTFTNHTAEDCINYRGSFTFIRSNGEVWKENAGYSDNGSIIRMKVTTNWLSFADLQGYKRVYKLLVLGEYKSPHKLEIKVAQDFNPAYTQSSIIDPDSSFNQSSYGSNSPYGSQPLYGGNSTVYQFETRLSDQKCQSIKFSIQDHPESATEAFSISNIAMEVGVKQGLNKLGESRSFKFTK